MAYCFLLQQLLHLYHICEAATVDCRLIAAAFSALRLITFAPKITCMFDARCVFVWSGKLIITMSDKYCTTAAAGTQLDDLLRRQLCVIRQTCYHIVRQLSYYLLAAAGTQLDDLLRRQLCGGTGPGGLGGLLWSLQ